MLLLEIQGSCIFTLSLYNGKFKMSLNPLRIAATYFNMDDHIPATPLSSFMHQGTHILYDYAQCGKATRVVEVICFSTSVLTSCVAVAEAIASLAYASLASFAHVFTLCNSRRWQDHVIKSWGFFRHSLQMVCAPQMFFKERKIEMPYLKAIRQPFYKIQFAQQVQSLNFFFNFFASRIDQNYTRIPTSTLYRLQVAIEGIPMLIQSVKSKWPTWVDKDRQRVNPRYQEVNNMGLAYFFKRSKFIDHYPEMWKSMENFRLESLESSNFIEIIFKEFCYYKSKKADLVPSKINPKFPYSLKRQQGSKNVRSLDNNDIYNIYNLAGSFYQPPPRFNKATPGSHELTIEECNQWMRAHIENAIRYIKHNAKYFDQWPLDFSDNFYSGLEELDPGIFPPIYYFAALLEIIEYSKSKKMSEYKIQYPFNLSLEMGEMKHEDRLKKESRKNILEQAVNYYSTLNEELRILVITNLLNNDNFSNVTNPEVLKVLKNFHKLLSVLAWNLISFNRLAYYVQEAV